MNKKQFIRDLSIGIICLIVLVVSIISITHNFSEVLKEDTMEQLSEVTQQTVTIVQEKAKSDVVRLERLSATISLLGGPFNDETKKYIKGNQIKKDGVEFTVTDAGGEYYTSDGFAGNIRNEELFKKAMSGESIISDVSLKTSGKSDAEALTLIVPIYEDAKIVGTLSAVGETKTFEKLVNFSVYGGKGYNYIIRANGDAVVFDEHGGLYEGFVPKNNLSDENLLETEPGLIQLKEDMAANKSGILKYTPKGGVEMYLSYAPLNINDWYIVNRVSSKDIEVQKDLFKKEAIAIVVVVFAVFGVMTSGVLISYKRRIKDRENVALHDKLTGLPNWKYLQRHFSDLQAKTQKIYVIVRIPEFQKIGEVFGYRVVAKFLKDIANELSKIIAEDEIVVHVTEDCFALLLNDKGTTAATEKYVDDIFRRLTIVDIEDGSNAYDYRCYFVGGAYRLERRDEEFSSVNRKANTAVESYVKNDERPWAWFTPAMESKIAMQDSLMPDILNALKNEEFVPFFQPQYDVNTKEIVGAEILARWHHPVYGILMPGDFVPLLEARGCVLELDLIMFEQACKMIHGWLESGLLPVCLSVNISRLNIHRHDFFDRLIAIARKYEIPGSLISLELREAAMSENSQKVLKIAKILKKEGFKLAIDDVRTGTSLGILHSIPLDTIKFSRSFLINFDAGERGNVILKHLVKMGQELGMNIVAEGVETAEQEEMIRVTGCDYAQGFYFSRPLAAMDFEELVFKESSE